MKRWAKQDAKDRTSNNLILSVPRSELWKEIDVPSSSKSNASNTDSPLHLPNDFDLQSPVQTDGSFCDAEKLVDLLSLPDPTPPAMKKSDSGPLPPTQSPEEVHRTPKAARTNTSWFPDSLKDELKGVKSREKDKWYGGDIVITMPDKEVPGIRFKTCGEYSVVIPSKTAKSLVQCEVSGDGALYNVRWIENPTDKNFISQQACHQEI